MDYGKSTKVMPVMCEKQIPGSNKITAIKPEKIEKPEIVKRPQEKIQTYSFPGQYTSMMSMQNKLFKDLSKEKASPSPNKKSNLLVFDPSTQKANYINNN